MARKPDVELRDLLLGAFTSDGLKDLLQDLEDSQELIAEIHWEGSAKKVAREVADALIRFGAADAAFFERLVAARPRKVAEIRAVAELFEQRKVANRSAPPPAPTPAAIPAPPAPAPIPAGAPAFVVPFARKALTGRAAAMDALRAAFAQPKHTTIGPAVAIVGVGGLGKTQLAIECAYAARDAGTYPGGIFWITADHELEPQLQVLSDAGRWAPAVADPAYKIAAARRILPTLSEALVIVDNVESFTRVQELFGETSRPHLLLTSVGYVPVPKLAVNLLLPAEESLALFLAESGRALDAPERAAADRLLGMLGGWPLAIELAGAYLKYNQDMSVEDYAAALDDHGLDAEVWTDPVLDGASATRHRRSLRATLQVDAKLLDDQPILREILDVLAWSGSAAMGRALLGACLGRAERELAAALATGVRLQLLRAEGAHRYRVHRLMRDALREQSTPSGEVLRLRAQRLAAWFTERREDFRHLAEFEAEFDHLEFWQRTAETRDWTWEAITLQWLQAYPSYHWGRFAQGEAVVLRALSVFDRGRLVDPMLEVRLCSDLDALLSRQWKNGARRPLLERAERLLPELPASDAVEHVRVLAGLAGVAGWSGEISSQAAFAERATEAAQRLPEGHSGRLEAESCLIGSLARRRRIADAITRGERLVATAIAVHGAEHPNTWAYIEPLGHTLQQAGRLEEARARFLAIRKSRRRSLPDDMLGAAGNEVDLARWQRAWGLAQHARGDSPAAGAAFQASLGHADEALRLRSAVLPPESEGLTDVLETKALALWDLGAVTHDPTHLRAALQVLDQALAVGDPETPTYRRVRSRRDQWARRGVPGFRINAAPAPARPRRPALPAPIPTPPPSGPVRMLLAYAELDAEPREAAIRALRPLTESGRAVLTLRPIPTHTGRGLIDPGFHTAHLLIFLVTPEFLASDYCWDVEMKEAMERQGANVARVLPVHVAACAWARGPFGEVPGVPDPRVSLLEAEDPAVAWSTLGALVTTAVDELLARRAGR